MGGNGEFSRVCDGSGSWTSWQQGLAIAVSFLHEDVTKCSNIPAWKRHSRLDTTPEGFNLQPEILRLFPWHPGRSQRKGSLGRDQTSPSAALSWIYGIAEKPPKVSKKFMETELSTPFALELKSGRNNFFGMIQREAGGLGTSVVAEGCVCDRSYSQGLIVRNRTVGNGELLAQDAELSLSSPPLPVLMDLGFPLLCNLPTNPMSSRCPTQTQRGGG